MLDKIQKLTFELLEASCLAEGGDGDAMLLCPNYINQAKLFDEWLEENSNTYWAKNTYGNYIIYYNNQEAIWFTNDESVCPCVITVIKTTFLQ
jgi:hypothetical protein